MSKRRSAHSDKQYHDFALRHILFESQPRYSLPENPIRKKETKPLQRSEHQRELEYCKTAPSPQRGKEENFVLRSTMSQKWCDGKVEVEKKQRASQPASIFQEVERSRMLETRLKELSDKYFTLQRSYKDLLTRVTAAEPPEDYKARYEALSEMYARHKETFETRISELELELQRFNTARTTSPKSVDTFTGSNLSPLHKSTVEDMSLHEEMREVKARLAAAEERIRVLEETTPLD